MMKPQVRCNLVRGVSPNRPATYWDCPPSPTGTEKTGIRAVCQTYILMNLQIGVCCIENIRTHVCKQAAIRLTVSRRPGTIIVYCSATASKEESQTGNLTSNTCLLEVHILADHQTVTILNHVQVDYLPRTPPYSHSGVCRLCIIDLLLLVDCN